MCSRCHEPYSFSAPVEQVHTLIPSEKDSPMGKYCCMYINEFNVDQPADDEREVVKAEEDFTPEEVAVLAE